MQQGWFHARPVRYLTRISRSLWSDPVSRSVAIEAAVRMGADTVMPFSTTTLDPQHPTIEAVRERAAELATAFAPARDAGLRVEVNFYSTQGHGPRATDTELDWVVGSDGVELVSIPCPLGVRSRRYLVEAYGAYLDATGTVVWIDDDLRLDNHRGSLFECCCPTHLAGFAERTSRTWTVTEIDQLMRRSPQECTDEDLRHRAAWREWQAAGLADLCRLLAERAAAVGAAVARMTPGGFAGHLRTGVDLDTELQALQVATPVPDLRLGGAVYSDDIPRNNLIGQLNMDADAATLTTACRPYTEIDTFPGFPGQKSVEVLQVEMVTATAGWGADHTLAILPGHRRLVPDPLLHDSLARHRHRLTSLRTAIAELIADGGVRRGASQLVSTAPEVSARRDLTVGASLPWNVALAQLGTTLNPHDPEVIIIDAETVRSWTAGAIAERLDSTAALITAEALHLLQREGLVGDRGVTVRLAEDPVTYEVEEFSIPGVPVQRAMSWIWAAPDRRHLLDVDGEVDVWSTQLGGAGQRAPGMVVVPAGLGRPPLAVTTHQPGELRDPGRQRLFHEVFDRLAGRRTPAIRSALNVYPIQWGTESTDLVVLTNYGHTTFPDLTLDLPSEPDRVERLDADGAWVPLRHDGATVTTTLPGPGFVVVRIHRRTGGA